MNPKELTNVLDRIRDSWLEGYETALRDYAWWKDGTQYVGSCGKTLAEAIKEVRSENGYEVEGVSGE